MMTNLLVGLLFVICLAAGIWGWWLENGGSGGGTDTGADDEPGSAKYLDSEEPGSAQIEESEEPGEADENSKSVM